MLDYTGIDTAVGDTLVWVGKTMEIFSTAPAIYFVGFALVTAAAGVAKAFVPMRKK